MRVKNTKLNINMKNISARRKNAIIKVSYWQKDYLISYWQKDYLTGCSRTSLEGNPHQTGNGGKMGLGLWDPGTHDPGPFQSLKVRPHDPLQNLKVRPQ